MKSKSYQKISVEIVNDLANVTLNCPEARNAFNQVMIRELSEAFGELNKLENLIGVVLRGEGKSFCSGADLGYMKSMAEFTFDENVKDAEALHAMFWCLRSLAVPLIGQLQGHVMGGGIGLAAVCDVNAVVNDTQFCFSEVKLGLAPAVISPFVLERMSPSMARRYMLTGEIFGPQEALQSGLAHFSGSESEVKGFVDNLIQTLGKNGPEAVRETKRLLRTLNETADWTSRRAMTTKVIAERRVSQEGQEGLNSFFEKRSPKWRKS